MRKEELELIKYRIDKAYKTLEAAEKLYTEKYYNSSINRANYACFYAVNAILFLNNLSSSKHSGIINLFNLHFIKTNIIEKKYGKFYSDLFRQRQESDYEDFKEFDKKETLKFIDGSKEFINYLKNYIEGKILK